MGVFNEITEMRHVRRTIPSDGLSYVWLLDTVADITQVTGGIVTTVAVSPSTLSLIRARFQTQQRFREILLRGVECLIEPSVGVIFPTKHLGDNEIELFTFPLPPHIPPGCPTCGNPSARPD